VSASASQAFVERLFCVRGILTSGRRNIMQKSLNIHAWLNVNLSELADIGNLFNKFGAVSCILKNCTMMN